VYWSVDASGNVEPVNEASFTVVAQEEDDSADENATRSLPTTGSDAFVLLPLAGVFAVLGGALRRRAHR
jgi:LPXTG-motif cell wall-anchored protein